MTLICPNPEFICAVRTRRFCLEGKPLLGIVANDPFERLHIAAFEFWSLHLHIHSHCRVSEAARIEEEREKRTDEIFNSDKAVRSQFEALLGRSVPQDVAQRFAPARVGVIGGATSSVLGHFRSRSRSSRRSAAVRDGGSSGSSRRCACNGRGRRFSRHLPREERARSQMTKRSKGEGDKSRRVDIFGSAKVRRVQQGCYNKRRERAL